VLIGGRPAWRARVDAHACPLTTAKRAHVGGAVSAGSSSVTIGGEPAARQGDSVIEASGANAIVGGDATVLIG
jgi:uncharacterized Zn-binding protein involved in type VI secretion